MVDFRKEIKILLKNLMVFVLEKLYFPFNHKTRGSLKNKNNGFACEQSFSSAF